MKEPTGQPILAWEPPDARDLQCDGCHAWVPRRDLTVIDMVPSGRRYWLCAGCTGLHNSGRLELR